MAQSYFPGQTTSSPLPVNEASYEGLGSQEKLYKVEDVQEAYIDHKDRYVHFSIILYSFTNVGCQIGKRDRLHQINT